MIKKLLVMSAIATVALMAIPADPADARRGIRGGGGFRVVARGPVVRHRVIGVRPFYARRHVRVIRRFPVAPIVVASSGCEWLHRRAVITGNPAWWRRYYACRGY